MADDSVSATTVIDAPAEAIFAVLADPAKHTAIDGTGWDREHHSDAHLRLVSSFGIQPRAHRIPPFPPEHLGNSLAHLAELVTHGPARAVGSTA